MKRFVVNLFSSVKKYTDTKQLTAAPIIAYSESDLWNPFDNKDNWILTAGKIENLRIAAKKLDGLEIKANAVFSFWKHIGNPNFGQGYVVGREIREGCVVPTIAGGLCQISNALYDAALNANFDIIERHRHTKVIKGSLAEQNRDATVKWNYIDLRFKSSFDFRMEVTLTSNKLIVRFKSKQQNQKTSTENFETSHANHLNDCYSCGNTACFTHTDRTSKKQNNATTTFILDEKWVEYDDYIKTISSKSDLLIVPIKNSIFIKSKRYAWSVMKSVKIKATCFYGIYRALKLRYASKNNNVFELKLELDKRIAKAASKKIPIDSTHIVVSQNLLPFLYETGALGGRTFDVLMTHLPLKKLQERLDLAYTTHPKSPTLKDFRAPAELIQLENDALNKAQKIITPHAEVAALFKNKVKLLNWDIPNTKTVTIKGNKVLFPAALVGRKGAYEIKSLAEELNLNLVVKGKNLEGDSSWKDFNYAQFDGDYAQIKLVIFPTYIANQPRYLLKLIGMGIPIITTTACGINSSTNVKVFDINDLEGIKKEVKNF